MRPRLTRWLLLLLILVLAPLARANQAATGWCSSGNQPVVLSGLTSTNVVQGSFPQCTVTVNNVGGGIATIFADNSGTPLANPFTATINGQWTFYAANGRYSVTLSGFPIGTTPSNVTFSDILLFDPSTTNITFNNLNLLGTLSVAGATTLSSTLGVTGATTLASLTASSLNVSGNASLLGGLTVKTIEKVAYVDNANTQNWSGADACAWMNSALASLPTTSGFPVGALDIRGLASTSTVTCGTTVYAGSPYLTILAPGPGALVFNCTANADCWNFQEDHFGTPTNAKGEVVLGGFTLEGPGSSDANAGGFHMGDMTQGLFEGLQACNFTGTNGFGMWWENVSYFFEDNTFINPIWGECPGSIAGNTKDFRVSVNASATSESSSFTRDFIINGHYASAANQTSLALDGGAISQNVWNIEGNTESSTGTTVLEMSGSTYPSSGVNTFFSGEAYLYNECTSCSGAQYYNIPSGYTFDFVGQLNGGSGFNYSTGLSGTVHHRLNGTPLEVTNLVAYSASGGAENEYDITVNNPMSNRTLSLNDPGANADFILSQGYIGSKGLSIGGAPGSSSVTGDITAQRSSTLGVYWMGTDNNGYLERTGNTALLSAGTSLHTFPTNSGTVAELNLAQTFTAQQTLTTVASATNCSSAASPAVCGSAIAGSVVVAAATTSVVVDTTAVTANSQIILTPDSSLGTKLSVTCNTTAALLDLAPWISARTAGTSFTITLDGAPTTNPECLSYTIIN